MNKFNTKTLQHNSYTQAGEPPLNIKKFFPRLRKLWSLLPPQNGQSLLKYIVYRLEDSDNFSLSEARKKILFYTRGILFFVAAISLALLLARKIFLPNDTYWINELTHTLLESFSGLISVIIGIILSWEYFTSNKKNILFLVYGFFVVGIFDFFHVFSNYCIDLFVWYHSSGALLGSFFFLVSMFVYRNDETYTGPLVWVKGFSIFAGIFVIILVAVLFETFYSYIPHVLSVSLPHHTHVSMAKGKFSYLIYAVNLLSSIFYLCAGILRVRGFLKTNDVIYLIFGTAMLLFFMSELFFAFSHLWDPVWWYWHIIKIVIFAGLLLGLAYGFTKVFYRLYTSKMQLSNLLEKIKGKNIEIEKAYAALKETQKYLCESEKLASIGKMAAIMAHEIRNPLGAISNSVGVLKKYSLRPEENTEILNLVEGEMERLNKLTDDFLSFARPSQLRRDKTDLNALLSETLALLNNDKTKYSGISFQEAFSPDIPFLMIDRNHIKQVFINILMNSIQAMPKGGVLTIQTNYKKTEDEVEITFADTGAGMPEEVLSQVFQPFFTTKDKGLGLGLNIIHKIVKEHGGYIAISSKEGKGTEIKLRFPVNPITIHTVIPDTGV